MSTVKIVLISCLVSTISIIFFEYTGIFHNTVYNCDSPQFNELPDSVQEECVHIIENELRDLIERKLQDDATRKYIEV